MTKISATVVADSKNKQGDRITTLLVTFPRFILAELNTHRMLSKNSASSRAIPFVKMVKSVQENPFIPIAWQKDHKGMQGIHYFNDKEAKILNDKWLKAKHRAIESALDLAAGLFEANEVFEFDEDGNLVILDENVVNVTKQLVNRLLEPFMWHTVLITATEWENFFALRCPKYISGEPKEYRSKKDYIKRFSLTNREVKNTLSNDPLFWFNINKGQAEIHMMTLAESMWDAMNESTPKQLQPGEWHIPFEDKIDTVKIDLKHDDGGWSFENAKIKIATAMAARTSYTVVGDEKEFTYEQQIALHDRMANAVSFHASPFEHCARAMSDDEYHTFFKGEILSCNHEKCKDKLGTSIIANNSDYGWCRNFKGFIQYRHILEQQK